ncbi:virulence factor [Janthinobacterium sp.]|uniref:virulence factor n=1 Tax=Janthinobacterium sp. TaxID=1871054 RepID=UPI00261F721A|nr:virulence factor [Janthinobacterium sp.]
MTKSLFLYMFVVFLVLSVLTACMRFRPAASVSESSSTTVSNVAKGPFVAQVVGLQWLNPLQRKDYPTEWQLLWTLGLVQTNPGDDMVREKPEKYIKLQSIASVAVGNNGSETFDGYHEKYVEKLFDLMHDVYYSDPEYFYNVHSTERKSHWRELAGIHIEYALPDGKLDRVEAADFVREYVANTFSIGNVHSPTLWTRSTPPDVRVTMGGPNAGFTSLSAALDYLQTHPKETVWAMNWDAPSRPKDRQINENLVLLVLAGPDYKTERSPLAWLGYPVTKNVSAFETKQGQPSRSVQAWTAAIGEAAGKINRQETDIGYLIHDAGNTSKDVSDRIGPLAQTLTMQLPEFDFLKQSFNMPALLGETGAGTALTNVALGIAYAHHFGKPVLVAGTSDLAAPVALVVAPPAVPRPIQADKSWFRARSGNYAYLPWWGLRHDAREYHQGFSQ